MRNLTQWSVVSLGICVAAGLTLCGYFVGQTLYNAKVAVNTAQAKGLSQQRVLADTANWKISFTVEDDHKDKVPDLYKKAQSQQTQIINLLRAQGFKDNQIKPGVLDYRKSELRNTQKQLVKETHRITGQIRIESNQVDLVQSSRSKINQLIAQGYNITNHDPEYRFTKLNQIKPAMLREATKNARISADEFAKNAGTKVGSIRTAKQGNFSIRDVGDAYYSTKRIEKDVRVVTTITFYLTQ